MKITCVHRHPVAQNTTKTMGLILYQQSSPNTIFFKEPKHQGKCPPLDCISITNRDYHDNLRRYWDLERDTFCPPRQLIFQMLLNTVVYFQNKTSGTRGKKRSLKINKKCKNTTISPNCC
ncbi:hypothetical protein FKM82_023174 [Ascaphus truei]